jgi:hypothetical protein
MASAEQANRPRTFAPSTNTRSGSSRKRGAILAHNRSLRAMNSSRGIQQEMRWNRRRTITLESKLQEMTRELELSVVVDGTAAAASSSQIQTSTTNQSNSSIDEVAASLLDESDDDEDEKAAERLQTQYQTLLDTMTFDTTVYTKVCCTS